MDTSSSMLDCIMPRSWCTFPSRMALRTRSEVAIFSHASTRPDTAGPLQEPLGKDQEQAFGQLRADLRLLVRRESSR